MKNSVYKIGFLKICLILTSKDINEKGLKHTIETKYNYGNE